MTEKRKSFIKGLFISVLFLAGVLPFGFSRIKAATKDAKGVWEYEYEGKRLTITGYTGNDSVLKIPSKIDGKNVVGIGRSVFEKNENLISVSVPKGVETIAFSAFKGCINLESITLPKTLRVIESFVFSGCTKLDGVVLPDSLRSLGGNCFSSCTALKSIIIPKRCKDIGDGVFSYCENLETVLIKSRTKWITGRLFWGCTKLAKVTIPETIRFVRGSAFGCCDSLEKVHFNDECREVGGCFWENDLLSTVIFGRKTVKLGYELFGGCKHITTLVIPESVTEINDGFFSRYYGEKTGITVVTTKGSYAEKWAESNNMNVEYNIDDYYN